MAVPEGPIVKWVAPKAHVAVLHALGFIHYEVPHGPIVKWYYAAFALRRRESDSPWVHKLK